MKTFKVLIPYFQNVVLLIAPLPFDMSPIPWKSKGLVAAILTKSLIITTQRLLMILTTITTLIMRVAMIMT